MKATCFKGSIYWGLALYWNVDEW